MELFHPKQLFICSNPTNLSDSCGVVLSLTTTSKLAESGVKFLQTVLTMLTLGSSFGTQHLRGFNKKRINLVSIRSLNLKGIDLLALCIQKLRNGVSIRNCNVANRVSLLDWSQFLRRTPRGGIEATQFVDLKCRIGDVTLSDHNDAWNWSPNTTKGFSVASARSLVDSHILKVSPIATHWNGCIPIKVNIFLWKLLLNKLPSRVNLDRRGIDIPSILCPNCQEDVETGNHIFFTCEMASTLWSMLDNWWEVDIPLCANMED
ncbi:RNA-directed DNA polymerase, eukaryota, reverse transcriptase zinc-binding domain protein [Tanacetum coccineum]